MNDYDELQNKKKTTQQNMEKDMNRQFIKRCSISVLMKKKETQT